MLTSTAPRSKPGDGSDAPDCPENAGCGRRHESTTAAASRRVDTRASAYQVLVFCVMTGARIRARSTPGRSVHGKEEAWQVEEGRRCTEKRRQESFSQEGRGPQGRRSQGRAHGQAHPAGRSAAKRIAARLDAPRVFTPQNGNRTFVSEYAVNRRSDAADRRRGIALVELAGIVGRSPRSRRTSNLKIYNLESKI
jgi:hypothetical protein